MKLRLQLLAIAALLLISACGMRALAQTAPDAHASHHPVAGAAPMPAGGDPAAPALPGAAPMTPADNRAAPAGAGGQGMGGGMEAGMGEMMKEMGVPPRKEIYPSLMALPDEVTPEERAGIEQLAQERMKAGTALMSSGLEKLSDSTSNEDYAAMQQATVQMRDGLAQFEAGIAARRVLAEGKLPRNLALDWFKREMNLASPIRGQEPVTFLGVPVFHFFTMVLLIAFALAMVAMYFFKMRRAAALFGRLGSDANPPPGSSPPLAGAPGPSATAVPTVAPAGPAVNPALAGDSLNAG